MKKVTVITASYGHEKYIAHAIDSVLCQTYTEFDYIIFDDGSKDNSRSIIEEYIQKDERIKFHTHENLQNKGLPATIEAAVNLVKTPYIAFLESDDIWEPTFLEEMLNIAEAQENIALFYCGVKIFGDDNSNNSKHIKMLEKRKRFIQKESISRMDLVYERFISTFSSVLVRSSILKSCKFDPLIPQRLDNFLWIQCLIQQPAIYLDKELCRWRKHDSSFSRSTVEPYPLATVDMFFNLLYPNNSDKDKAFCHFWLTGKKEKIFRKQIRAFLRFYFDKKYRNAPFKIYSK